MYLFVLFDGAVNCVKQTMSFAVVYSPWRAEAPRSAAKIQEKIKSTVKWWKEKKNCLFIIKVSCQSRLRLCHLRNREACWACWIFLLPRDVLKAVCGPVRCVCLAHQVQMKWNGMINLSCINPSSSSAASYWFSCSSFPDNKNRLKVTFWCLSKRKHS